MNDPCYCVVNNQLGTGDVFVNGPFPTRKAAFKWAVAFATDQQAIYANDGIQYTVVDDGKEVVWLKERLKGGDNYTEIGIELTVQLLLSPQ